MSRDKPKAPPRTPRPRARPNTRTPRDAPRPPPGTHAGPRALKTVDVTTGEAAQAHHQRSD
ncbi:hypothetical protein, partial [Streptomyces sp. NPDC052535]|uniref:hypothetical protein n=1 Tax=Streptomyces sp. NPDC052535 TaxID=3155531 RepID=UPI0034222131